MAYSPMNYSLGSAARDRAANSATTERQPNRKSLAMKENWRKRREAEKSSAENDSDKDQKLPV